MQADLKNKSGIYFLFFLDDKGVLHFYIGSSVHIAERMTQHKGSLR